VEVFALTLCVLDLVLVHLCSLFSPRGRDYWQNVLSDETKKFGGSRA